jgi:hypothetical protein
VDIEASARKHGVSDDDMLHALRHHSRAFDTDDADVTMFIGPSTTLSHSKSECSTMTMGSPSSMRYQRGPSF